LASRLAISTHLTASAWASGPFFHASSLRARSPTAMTNLLVQAGAVLAAAGGCGSSNASAPWSCAPARRPHWPPPDATTNSSSTTLGASARTAFVRLDELPRPVLLVPAAFSAAERPAFLADHRFPCRSPIPLSPSKGSQPTLTALGQPDSKPIDPQPSSSGSLHIVVTQATHSLAPPKLLLSGRLRYNTQIYH
jgi:hypothetical protein